MIILTGASGGLGSQLVNDLKLMDEVILIFNKNKINIDGTLSVKLDISNENEVMNFVESNKSKLNNLTLINMATFSKDGLLANYDSSDWIKTFNINVNGPFFLIKNLLPIMISQKWGRIINISSYLANKGAIGASAYSSSKSALIGLTKSLAKEYARFNINSNILELGYFDGGLYNTLSEEIKTKILNTIPSKKLGEINEISACVDLIIKSKFINGSILKINGGL